MTNEQKEKMAQLKKKNADYAQEQRWNKNTLLRECLALLDNYRIIRDEHLTDTLLEITRSAGVEQIILPSVSFLCNDRRYYVVWDNADTPIIECGGNDILKNWDNILAVAFATCFIDTESQQAFLFK